MKAVLEQIRKHATTKQTKYNKVKMNIRRAAVLITLFGLGWVFGLVATGFPGEDTEVLTFILQVFFCIIVGLQGVLIFFFYVIQDHKAKTVWKGWYSKLTKHLPSIRKYKVSKRQEKRKLTPRPAAQDGTVQGLILSLSTDGELSPGTLSPRQQFAESLTVAEVLESSNRHHTHTRPEINTQASPSSMREEIVSSPLTDTSSLVDFENFDLVDWV